MSDQVKTPTLDELWAFVEGSLNPLRTIEISALMATNPATYKAVEEMAAHHRILETVDASVLEEPVPGHLIELVRRQARQSRQQN